ncbi:HNH endonuclease [Roseibium sp.]|uniref:HNH endonuclease n=1 Tax=Roseibium sp. TaxID=1936156 RepID=UPI0035158346
MTIQEARNFVIDRVIEPALNFEDAATGAPLPTKVVNSLKNTRLWIERFPSVGDLYRYISSTKPGNTYRELRSRNLGTFEDILGAFEQEFATELNDFLDPEAIPLGQIVDAHTVNILGRSYDLRSGGILPVIENDRLMYVLIKCTLTGGKYQNRWLRENEALKYYLKSIEDTFREHYKDNAAIIDNPGIPIHAFVRVTSDEPFTYRGVFRYVRLHRERRAMWFELSRTDQEHVALPPAEAINGTLQVQVSKSQNDSSEKRKKRLAKASKKPRKILAAVEVFVRNPDVIAEALEIANGHCQACGIPGPFERKKDGTIYLEVHHKVPLADGGDDTVENAIALCPNCHRNEHYGAPIF